MPSTIQKHIAIGTPLLSTYDQQSGYYLCYGYLTSQKNNDLIYQVQFETFQKQQEALIHNTELPLETKAQYIAYLKEPIKVSIENAKELKYGEKYLQEINNTNMIAKENEVRRKEEISIYNIVGHSKQDIINIYKIYVFLKTEKIDIPESEIKIQKQIENSKEQQQKQQQFYVEDHHKLPSAKKNYETFSKQYDLQNENKQEMERILEVKKKSPSSALFEEQAYKNKRYQEFLKTQDNNNDEKHNY